jgi:hypothetical protein
MLKNWFLITAASFGVGFGVTYVYLQSPTQSVIAGAAGTTGAIGSVLLCSKQRKQELERQAQSMKVTVNILEQQEKTLGQQLQSHQDNRQTIQYQVEQLEQQIAGLQSKQQGQEASIAKFDRELETKRNSVAELDAKRLELNTLTAEVASLQQQQAAAQSALLDLQNIESEITIYSATKAQLTLEVARLEEYKTEIKTQIADDKDTCEKAEEYLLFVDQEVNDKQADLLELDINIKSKVTELNTCRQQLSELSQQKTEAESAIKKLAIELQKAGDAILRQESIQYAAEAESAQLASDIASLKLELLDCHSQMTDASLQSVDVPQQQAVDLAQVALPVAAIAALATPSLIESLQPQESISEPEDAGLELVDMHLEESLPQLEDAGLELVDMQLEESLPELEDTDLELISIQPEALFESEEPSLEFMDYLQPEESISELEDAGLELVSIQPEALLSEPEAPSLDFMDYLDAMDSLDLDESSLQFADYLPTAESGSFPELVEPNLELVETSLPELAEPNLELVEASLPELVEPSLELVETSLPELVEPSLELVETSLPELVEPSLELADAPLPQAEPIAQFVEFQPVSLSMFDLEETSPISASSFSDLCDMDLIDISADPLELGLLDITDLDDMTLDQDSLDALNVGALDLNDITLDQEPLNPSAEMATNLPADFDWSENFIDNPYLAVLWHIDQHGSIEHFEVAAMLNDKKLAKQFATKLPEYIALLPFAINIEATKTGNRYQKRALVLVEA